MDNVQIMKNALGSTYVDRVQAEYDFEQAQKKIERINAKSINIYYDDVIGTIVEAVDTALTASFALYKSCQQLVEDLHETCQPLLEVDTPTKLIEDIAYEIEQLNDNCEFENDYTGTLDGIAFGRSARVSFHPSDEAKDIERFWQNLVQSRRRSDPKPAVAPTPAKPKPEPAKAPDTAKLAKQKEHAETVMADCRAKATAYKTALSQEVDRLMEAYKADIAARLKSVQEDKATHEAKLAAFGFFAFGDKKAEKAVIARLDSTIAELQDPELIKAEKKRLSSLSTKAANAYAKQVDQYLYQRFPSLDPSNIQYCYPFGQIGDYLRLVNWMRPRKAYTAENVADQFRNFSSAYIALLLKKMKEMSYVSIAADQYPPTYTVTAAGKARVEKLEIDPVSYAECAKAAALPCPEAPNAADAFH